MCTVVKPSILALRTNPSPDGAGAVPGDGAGAVPGDGAGAVPDDGACAVLGDGACAPRRAG
jgi:hypothetical protein